MAGVPALAVAGERGLVDLLGLVQHLVGQLPHAGAERLVLLDGDEVDGDGLADGLAQDGAVEGHLVDVAEAPAVGLEPLEAVACLEVHDAVFAGEPVDADLAGDVAVGGADGRLGRAVVQQRGGGRVRPDRLLQLQDEAEVLLADNLLRLATQPVGVCLRGLAVWLVCLRIHWTVGDEELLVEGGTPLQDEAMGGSAKRQGLCVSTGDFAAGLAAIEFWGFTEVGQKVARHVLAASAGGVVLVRWDGEESACVHRCSLFGVLNSGLFCPSPMY